MKKAFLAAIAAILFSSLPAQAQSVREFKAECDSLSTLIQERTSVKVQLTLKQVSLSGGKLDLRFSESLSDVPWKEEDIPWLRRQLKALLPEKYANYDIGKVYGNGILVEELAMPALSFDGNPMQSKFRGTDLSYGETPLIEKVGALHHSKGLSGRHIALWQSHGRYYDEKAGGWRWQRAQFFTTVEDMYTQSYVLPLLIPMLENAGAYVMTPRERDTQAHESVVDNDPTFGGLRSGMIRRSGAYVETGDWAEAGTGFADLKEKYSGNDNPFTMGSSRVVSCTEDSSGDAGAKWTPDIPERGKYAVYISYKSLPNSTRSAHYTVHHLGGTSEFIVNQQMGGGTWIYLGTFEFAQGSGGSVELDNGTPDGRSFEPGTVVTADAVRFGGGMGKIARGPAGASEDELTTSGLPSYMEGALYWLQWAGIDSTITRRWDGDYTNDFADRGQWVGRMAGGSKVNPDSSGMKIPIDLSLAFHSDAGVSPNDSTIGTLAIYTLLCDKKRTLPSGEDRMMSREYADYVQSQVVRDVREQFNPKWSRRELWDRSYSESRTTSVPGILLELLSHQNFADMKMGLDPGFRFTVCRAVYKGMLKFLSNRYGCPYAVQPLPISSFAAVLEQDGQTVRLSWTATKDSLEATADPTGFIISQRMDDGAFGEGQVVRDLSFENGRYSTRVPIQSGHLYSFRVSAFNEGGISLPSEILSAGVPSRRSREGVVLVVNNFTRLAPPAWFDTPTYAGFNPNIDSGVGYGKELSFVGDMYEFRRDCEWGSNDAPGFGGSYGDLAGLQVGGNNFDYPAVHGRALMQLGQAFCSLSAKALSDAPSLAKNCYALDIVCGKQISTPTGLGDFPNRFQVYPDEFRNALKTYCQGGGNMLISGSNIGTDAWDAIYPVRRDSIYMEQAQEFIVDVLGFKRVTNYGSRTGFVEPASSRQISTKSLEKGVQFRTQRNAEGYCVETPDGIVPANTKKASVFLKYSDSKISAGVCFRGEGYKAVSLGFPIEAVPSEESRKALIKTALDYFGK